MTEEETDEPSNYSADPSLGHLVPYQPLPPPSPEDAFYAADVAGGSAWQATVPAPAARRAAAHGPGAWPGAAVGGEEDDDAWPGVAPGGEGEWPGAESAEDAWQAVGGMAFGEEEEEPPPAVGGQRGR